MSHEGPLHKAIVQTLLEQGCGCGEFTANLRAAVFEGSPDPAIDFSLRPDAYRIDESTQELFVYEVEVGHPLRAASILEYVRLWDFLDFYEWTLRLITVDRFAELKERDLQPLVIPLLAGTATVE